MKRYRSPGDLSSEIERLLAGNRASFHRSPLEEVSELLSTGRHYTWVGIYLTVGKTAAQRTEAGHGPHPSQKARPESRSKILVSIELAGRELGVLDVESDRANAFGSEDRVLLEKAADLLARFLAVRGKYLVRRARAAAAD